MQAVPIMSELLSLCRVVCAKKTLITNVQAVKTGSRLVDFYKILFDSGYKNVPSNTFVAQMSVDNNRFLTHRGNLRLCQGTHQGLTFASVEKTCETVGDSAKAKLCRGLRKGDNC